MAQDKHAEQSRASAQSNHVHALVECSLMIALATILSLIKLLELPYGGSVTIASMLPIILIAYRHGLKWGLPTGLAFGIVQQLFGLKNLSYFTSWQSIIAVVLLDYLVAFMVLGTGGVFRRSLKQPQALACGSILAGLLRYICHVVSGATVWAGLSIPTSAALLYSLGYNATYMIPETIVTAITAYFIGSLIDFRDVSLKRYDRREDTGVSMLSVIGGLLVSAAVIADTVLVFSKLQNAETGDFDVTGFAAVNWTPIAVLTVVAVAAAVILHAIAKKKAD